MVQGAYRFISKFRISAFCHAIIFPHRGQKAYQNKLNLPFISLYIQSTGIDTIKYSKKPAN
jgi:hypothetical protein